MELKTFQKNFKNVDINIMPYILVVSILIGIIFVVIAINNKLEENYTVFANVKDNEVVVIVNADDLEKIVNNNKMEIERNIFTYKIKKINNQFYGNNVYKEVFLDISNLGSHYLIDNNVIKIKIITEKTTILSYLFKTIKGE